MIKPYPPKWPRNLDFLTPLRLQTALDPDLELYHCSAIVSIPEGKKAPPETIKTDLGGSIKIDRISRNSIQINYGAPKLRSDSVFSQGEILAEIQKTIEIPEAVVKRRNIRQKIPKAVEDLEPFSGTEYIYYQQTAHGNQTNKIKNAFNMPFLRNPYHFIKGELMSSGIINPHDGVLKRLRSTLKTDWIIGEKEGYMALKDPIVSLKLPRALSGRKWWQDIGVPHPIEARINNSLFTGQIYQLDRRKHVVVV